MRSILLRRPEGVVVLFNGKLEFCVLLLRPSPLAVNGHRLRLAKASPLTGAHCSPVSRCRRSCVCAVLPCTHLALLAVRFAALAAHRLRCFRSALLTACACVLRHPLLVAACATASEGGETGSRGPRSARSNILMVISQRKERSPDTSPKEEAVQWLIGARSSSACRRR